MALFGFGRPRPEDAARRRVEDWARQAGPFPPGTIVKVNEIVCPDPACPGFETVILVMPPGERTFARKIAKPVTQVAQADVACAFAVQA